MLEHIIKNACKPTLYKLREGLCNALKVEERDGGTMTRAAGLLREAVVAVDRELDRIDRMNNQT